ncbi:MAG: hypothetical protein AAF789_13750, partial [Bacteroidota bacterium]
IQKINATHSHRLTQLGANYFSAGNMRRGELADQEYQVQVAALNATRDKAENDRIRPGFIKAREQMLADSYGGDDKALNQARKDLDKDPSLQWLHDPNEKRKEEKETDYENIEEDSKPAPDAKEPPNISARFDAVAEKDYHKTHSKFNRASENSDPQYMKGYPDATPPEGRKTKGDIDLTKEYNAREDFPGFDDYSPRESSVEPTMNGPDIDIGDRD